MKQYKCYTCKKVLDEICFHKNKSQKRGLSSDCKKCKKRWGKEFRKTELYRKNQLEWARKNRYSPKRRFYVYSQGAKDRNIEFSLTFKEFKSFWGKKCYYCGTEIEGIGIDRKDNEIGYTMENIVSCCPQCNRMKMALTREKFISKCIKIASIHS